MAKIEIYGREEPKEKKVLLNLVRTSNSVIVEAVDEHGKNISNLILFYDNGRVEVCSCINPDLPFELDSCCNTLKVRT